MKPTIKLFIGAFMAVTLFVSQTAWAGYVPSTHALATEQTQEQRAEIYTMLDRADVREALQEKGLSADEAKERVAMLSPSQVEQLKTQLDTIPAGEGAVGAVIGAVLIVFFVLLFTDLLGETDAYDFDD